jgi:hypothetical protein
VPSWGAPVSGDSKVFDGVNHYIGDVQATIDFGFDGIKLDGCGEFRNLSFFAQEFNKTGVPVMIVSCENVLGGEAMKHRIFLNMMFFMFLNIFFQGKLPLGR